MHIIRHPVIFHTFQSAMSSAYPCHLQWTSLSHEAPLPNFPLPWSPSCSADMLRGQWECYLLESPTESIVPQSWLLEIYKIVHWARTVFTIGENGLGSNRRFCGSHVPDLQCNRLHKAYILILDINAGFSDGLDSPNVSINILCLYG